MNRSASWVAALLAGLAMAGCGKGQDQNRLDAYSDDALIANKPAGTNAVIVRAYGFGQGTISISDPSATCVRFDPGDYRNLLVCWAYPTPSTTPTVTVNVAATYPDQFSGWGNGPCTGTTGGTCAITTDTDRVLGVRFDPPPPTAPKSEYSLHVDVLGSIDGEITAAASPAPAGGFQWGCTPWDFEDRVSIRRSCSATVPAGTQVTVTAIPSPGTRLEGWGGSCSGTGTCVVTMDQDRSVTAWFARGSVVPSSFTVGGSVTGLTGTGLVLATAGEPNLSVSSGASSFTFANAQPSGTAYAVTVAQQPSNPSQTCVVTNGSGTIGGANVTNVAVTCTTGAYTVGGTISGLAGTGLVLATAGEPNLSVSSGASSFTFANALPSGTAYAVTVAQQPSNPSQTCVVTNGSGTIGGGNVTNVAVTCTTGMYAIGGTISGLAGTGLVLATASEPNLSVSSGASSFTFANALPSGTAYAVTVAQQPSNPSQTCVVTNGSGTVTSGNVTGVSVSCTTNLYRVGGSVTGLSGTGLVLRDNGGDDLPIPASGTFQFSTPVASGNAYGVTVAQQPTGPAQLCTVSFGTGVVGSSDVASVAVSCATSSYPVAVNVAGLAGSGLVLTNSLDGGPGEALAVPSDGTFAFPTRGLAGSSYSVTVRTQPTSPAQSCAVSGGAGILGAATTVFVTCATNVYQVGGAIAGLAGSGLVLATAGEPNLPVASGASGFTFANALPSGTAYAVTVAQQPSNPSQTCVVTNGSGTIGGANVTNVAVTCTTNTYRVGGTVSGLAGIGLVLATSGEPNLAVPQGASSFAFQDLLASGTSYSVTVVQQPTTPSQTCVVANGAGTVGSADVTNVAVTCTTSTYAVGGTVSGLLGDGLVLRTAGEPDLAVAAGSATFTFASTLASGSPYDVTVVAQPTNPIQTCAVANGSGSIGSSDVTVTVTCTTNTYALGGTITGLAGTGLILATTGQPNLGVAGGATSFAFANPFPSGTTYSVVVYQQPINPAQLCTVTNGVGTVTASDVTGVAVTCRSAASTLAAGGRFTVRIRPDGTLWALGDNAYGQLGDGTTTDRSAPVQVGTSTSWASVATGGSHTVALMTDGTLYAWGNNSNGQLGDGTTTSRPLPVLIGTGYARVAAGDLHTLAVRSDGTLWAWGSDASGQLGDNGTAQRTSPFQIGTGFASVEAGDNHSVALGVDGTLWTWGSNSSGQLGDGTTTQRLVPTRIGSATDWAAVAAGGAHTLAVTTTGGLWAWGANASGQLGDNGTAQRTSPFQIGTGFASAAAGSGHSAAVKIDGTLWAWGSNSSGQLGDGTTTQRLVPTRVGAASEWASVAAGGAHTVAVKTDGSLWGWGLNDSGQIGSGPNTQQNSPVQVGTASNWTVVAAGYAHTLAVRADGTLWAWGSNASGQLGDNTTTMRTAPVQIGIGTTWTAVAAGTSHSLAMTNTGTVWAWGLNSSGQVGDGTTTQRLLPVQVGTGYTAIAAGADHSLATTANRLRAWGNNSNGQLGDGSTTNRSSPTQVGNFGCLSIAAGDNHSVAVRSNGWLYGWGNNSTGQLGDNTTTQRNAPTRIGSLAIWSKVAAGPLHTLSVRTDGTLWAWGANDYGQLGDNTYTIRQAPVQVGTATTWASVAGGMWHSAATRTDGTVWAWGDNEWGQVGDGTTTQRIVPVQVGAGYARISAGAGHTMGVKGDGTLWAWGLNSSGQLGGGDWWKVLPSQIP